MACIRFEVSCRIISCICDILQIVHNGVYVQLLKDDQHQFISASSWSEQSLQKLFHHVNNAFIGRLKLSFRADSIHVDRCLSPNASELQCRIGALHIKETQFGVDYESVGVLGVHLQPQVYEVLMNPEMREEYAMLFTHNALRGTVKHVVYEVGMLFLYLMTFSEGNNSVQRYGIWHPVITYFPRENYPPPPLRRTRNNTRCLYVLIAASRTL